MTAIVFFSAEEALAAAAAAEASGRPLTLVSPPAAGLSAGPAWFAAITRQVRQRFPQADLTFVLDCGDSPGAVLAALRLGLDDLAVVQEALSPALAAQANLVGARLRAGPIAAHDLRGRSGPAAIAALLVGDDGRGEQ